MVFPKKRALADAHLVDDASYMTYMMPHLVSYGLPPFITKRKWIISAVVFGNADLVRHLLDSPKWYRVRDINKYSLLQMAILLRRVSVFDYLMSLDFPLELSNWNGETALMTTVCEPSFQVDQKMCYYFASELIKKGANFNALCPKGETILNRAIWTCEEVAVRLINQKANVTAEDSSGNSPLFLALRKNVENEELIAALLCNGAVPDGTDFEYAVFNGSAFIQELIFLYLLDQTSKPIKMNLKTLTHLAVKSELFLQVLEHVSEVTSSHNDRLSFYQTLFLMKNDFFKKIAEKSGFFAGSEVLESVENSVWYLNFNDNTLVNINTILESPGRCDMIRYIQSLDSGKLVKRLLDYSIDLSLVSEIFCFLLSHGLNVNDFCLQTVFARCGKCELFDILTHMDVRIELENNHEKELMPALLYDVNADIDRAHEYSVENLDQVLDFSANSNIKECCLGFDASVDEKIEALPKVPLLAELARNVCRRFLVEKFEVKNMSQFSAVLKKLPISRTHEEILKFERKLY